MKLIAGKTSHGLELATRGADIFSFTPGALICCGPVFHMSITGNATVAENILQKILTAEFAETAERTVSKVCLNLKLDQKKSWRQAPAALKIIRTWRPAAGPGAAYPLATADAFGRLPVLGFIGRNRTADAIFPTIQASLLLLRQMAVVLGHIGLLALLQIGFTIFQMGGLPRSQRAVLHSIGDTPLLIAFSRVDFIDARMSWIDHARACARTLLRSGRSDQHRSAHRKD